MVLPDVMSILRAFEIEGLPVRVVSPAGLYRLNAGTVRGQDRVDAEYLREKFNLNDSDG